MFTGWYYEATNGQEEKKKAGGMIGDKRTETMLRGILRNLRHNIAPTLGVRNDHKSVIWHTKLVIWSL